MLQLPESERESLLGEAEFIQLPVGYTFARAGDPISSAFFPDTGVIYLVSEMTTGHQLGVTAVGPEGAIGLGPLVSVARYPHRLVVLIESHGYRVPSDRLHRLFERSAALRRVALMHLGRKLCELVTAAACSRVHSHRQRLARWLLVIADKGGRRSLRITHETLAQMVGGPRHAVTVALNDLRARGAIVHLRGRIEIVKRSILIEQACECYVNDAHDFRA